MISSRSVIAFHISESYWIFENLDIRGDCTQHHNCEHAFQITGNAIAATIRNNRLHEFNAMIKLNLGKVRRKGTKKVDVVFPSDVLIEGNAFFNSTPRKTTRPVSLINLDGGRRHIVRGNLIANFSKAIGNKVAYGAFMKALVRDGIFERNLVICELTH